MFKGSSAFAHLSLPIVFFHARPPFSLAPKPGTGYGPDRHIVIHAKRSLLYQQNSSWIKKNTNDMFDITKGSFKVLTTCSEGADLKIRR